MSTDYIPRKKIPYNEIRDLNVEGIKIQEAGEPKHSLDEACVLTDGENYLWARACKDGSTTFTRYGGNFVDGVIEVLEEHFGVELISEYDDDFHDLVNEHYRNDFITIQLPTADNPGPWKKIWPPEERKD